jgi:hypothetical protein
MSSGGTPTGGTGSAGSSGGAGYVSATWTGNNGGGGGASAAGVDGGNTAGTGKGGDGTANSITGSSVTYGGGGGGGEVDGSYVGVGGSGGGGSAVMNSAGGAGTDGLGGGGAGGSYSSSAPYYKDGGDGGDGVVIIRYLTNDMTEITAQTSTEVMNIDHDGLVTVTGDISVTGTIKGNGTHSAVASDLVGGLNADYLDGYDSSAFGDATAANQTTILSRIGTNSDAASMSDTLFAGQQYIWDNRASFGNTPYVYKNDGTTSLGKFLGFNGGGIACTNMVYSNASSDPYQLTAADCDTSTYNGTGKDVYYSVGACGGTMYISSTGNNATTIYKRYGGTYIVTGATASSHTYGSYRHYADSTCHTSSSSMTSYTVTDYTFGECGVDGSSTGACKVK